MKEICKFVSHSRQPPLPEAWSRTRSKRREMKMTRRTLFLNAGSEAAMVAARVLVEMKRRAQGRKTEIKQSQLSTTQNSKRKEGYTKKEQRSNLRGPRRDEDSFRPGKCNRLAYVCRSSEVQRWRIASMVAPDRGRTEGTVDRCHGGTPPTADSPAVMQVPAAVQPLTAPDSENTGSILGLVAAWRGRVPPESEEARSSATIGKDCSRKLKRS